MLYILICFKVYYIDIRKCGTMQTIDVFLNDIKYKISNLLKYHIIFISPFASNPGYI
jgi:hypothetical protein